MSNIVGADTPQKEEPLLKQWVSDVHIGVFFDGTSNNMVDGVYDGSKLPFRLSKQRKPHFVSDITSTTLCDKEKEKGIAGGFSNVAILYTLFANKHPEGNDLFKRVYVEGAGATDSTNSSFLKYNVNGLAFGKGVTGVVALVSKAIKEVMKYVSIVSDIDPKETNLHFYVFGFSRGSACARLFCHLLTREKNCPTLNCEQDFNDKSYGIRTYVNKDGRVEFLEEYKQNKKVTVDFLGIYDTVVSIGCLQRKDGSTTADTLGIIQGYYAGGIVGAIVGGVGGFLMGRDAVDFGKNGGTVAKVVGAVTENVDDLTGSVGTAIKGVGTVTEDVGDVIGKVGANMIGGGGTVMSKAGALTEAVGIATSVVGELAESVGEVAEHVGTVTGAVGTVAGVVGTVTGRIAKDPEWHYNNVEDYGQYIDEKIKNVCHICAMDEFRENFALTNIGERVPSKAVEIMIPGCHSDVGGVFLDMAKESYKMQKRKRIIRDNQDKYEYRNYSICLESCNVKPTYGDGSNVRNVSEVSLKNVGWIGDTAKVTCDNDDYIEIARYDIKGGYSDIPLAMLMEYFLNKVENLKKVNDSKFFSQIPEERTYSRLKDLKAIGDNMVNKMRTVGKGQRYWFIPKNVDDYKSLRSKYLHFSAKDNYVYAPNYDDKGVMCRITYHGDKGKRTSAAEGVHFMYELSGKKL